MHWNYGLDPVEDFFHRFGRFPPDSIEEWACPTCGIRCLWDRREARGSSRSATYGCRFCHSVKTVASKAQPDRGSVRTRPGKSASCKVP